MPDFPSSTASKATIKDAMTEQGYTDTRAGNIDNIDAAVSTRAAPTDILLDIGEKVDGAKTGEILTLETPVEGVAEFLAADTYPKTVILATKEIGKPFYLNSLIDLTELVGTNEVTVKESAKLTSGGSYVEYASADYEGPQGEPLLKVISMEAIHGIQLELTMDAAPSVDTDIEFNVFVGKK